MVVCYILVINLRFCFEVYYLMIWKSMWLRMFLMLGFKIYFVKIVKENCKMEIVEYNNLVILNLKFI